MIDDPSLRIVLAATTALAAGLFALDLGGPVRVAALLVFVLVCPGLAWARLLRLGDGGDVLALGVALSVAVAALVGQAMALARWWSPGTGLLVLAALTLAGVALQPSRETADTKS